MSRRFITMARIAGGLLSAYWIVLFISTHVPVQDLPSPKALDKIFHFMGYGGLAFLLATATSTRWRMTWTIYLTLFGIAACYGALDELMQGPVGRTPSVLDWAADLMGTAVALSAHAIALRAVGTSRDPWSSDETPVSDESPTILNSVRPSPTASSTHRTAGSIRLWTSERARLP